MIFFPSEGGILDSRCFNSTYITYLPHLHLYCSWRWSWWFEFDRLNRLAATKKIALSSSSLSTWWFFFLQRAFWIRAALTLHILHTSHISICIVLEYNPYPAPGAALLQPATPKPHTSESRRLADVVLCQFDTNFHHDLLVVYSVCI
jgi:hypothetical protein